MSECVRFGRYVLKTEKPFIAIADFVCNRTVVSIRRSESNVKCFARSHFPLVSICRKRLLNFDIFEIFDFQVQRTSLLIFIFEFGILFWFFLGSVPFHSRNFNQNSPARKSLKLNLFLWKKIIWRRFFKKKSCQHRKYHMKMIKTNWKLKSFGLLQIFI